jgi:hypothetical protein
MAPECRREDVWGEVEFLAKDAKERKPRKA